MAKIGYFLSSEERTAAELIEGAARAEQAGFEALWISDHYHPWNREQGQSPFVWAVLGGIARATERATVTTAVTCPTVRIHPAVIAQAAATVATLMPGRFLFGVGSGEALNEHILGDPWPEADVRLEMLEEAIEVIRALWSGQTVSHRGRHYTVEHAKVFSRPDQPPPIVVSAFGPKALALAARVGDGWCTTSPDADSLRSYREQGGRGVTQAGLKACWGPDEGEAVALAHRLWANEALPGEAAQVVPTPEHFEQLSSLVTPQAIAESIPCGPDPERHVEAVRPFLEAGFDEVYVAQIGPDQQGFLEFYAREVLPRLDAVGVGG
jgi:G6PDH family F420-dependent oxidoreductase